MRAGTIVLAAILVLAGTPAFASEATDHVHVRSNVFDPVDIHVPQGQTVTWTLVDGSHTVTSDIKNRFDSGVMDKTGQTFKFGTPRSDVTLYYHCKIHGIGGPGDRWGSGMVARIVVGAGSPEPATPSDIEVRRVPSARWRTLDKALDGLEADKRYRVELRPGKYRPFDITPARLGLRGRPKDRFELVIRGIGSRPSDVVFEGGDTGLGLSVDGVRLENISFRRQAFASVFVQDIDRWSLEDVIVSRPGRYGVWVENARRGLIRRAAISGARVAGISVRVCGECDLLVDSLSVRASLQGIVGRGAGALVVRGSTFQDNGAGIVLKETALPPKSVESGDILHRGAHVFLNTFRKNTRPFKESAREAVDYLPVGAGIWIDGGAFDVIERNEFSGHTFGVVLTGPSHSSRVFGNTLSASQDADVAWDGLGAGVCFTGNVAPDGKAATSMPPLVETLYSCDFPATAGIPYPVVDAMLLSHGAAEVSP
jgi:plastocyanin